MDQEELAISSVKQRRVTTAYLLFPAHSQPHALQPTSTNSVSTVTYGVAGQLLAMNYSAVNSGARFLQPLDNRLSVRAALPPRNERAAVFVDEIAPRSTINPDTEPMIQYLRPLGIGVRGVLILLTAFLVWAQVPDQRGTAFPSDSKDPRQIGGAELLDAVCPGAVAIGKDIGCATGCSDGTSFGKFGERLPWSLKAVTLGHFLSATSEDAVLWMSGCEPHSLNFSGAILLTKKPQGWAMLWYKAGVDTARCHKVARRDGREILVCIGTAGAQGNSSADLYVEDLLNPKPTLMAGQANDGTFFAAFDDTRTCGWQQGAKEQHRDSVIHTHIDKVEFLRGGRDRALQISVTASFGRQPMTREDVQACLAGKEEVLPATRSYRMDFLYDGQGYKPAPSSAETVRMFKSR